jgi:site-specific DNA-cytosine methylase
MNCKFDTSSEEGAAEAPILKRPAMAAASQDDRFHTSSEEGAAETPKLKRPAMAASSQDDRFDTSSEEGAVEPPILKRPAMAKQTQNKSPKRRVLKRPARATEKPTNAPKNNDARSEDTSEGSGSGAHEVGNEALTSEFGRGDHTAPQSAALIDVALWSVRELRRTNRLEKLQRATEMELRIGSLCTGFGTDAMACDALSDAWTILAGELGLRGDFKFKHEMMCEVVQKKRDVLIKGFDHCGVVIGDITETSEKFAWCHKAGRLAKVPSDLDILFAGFSCKALSALLQFRGKTNISSTESSTGKTWDGVQRYCAEHKPKILILENVLGLLAKGRIQVVMSALEEIGYIGTYLTLASRNYLLPQTRQRVWLYFVRRDTGLDLTTMIDIVKFFKRDQHVPLMNVIKSEGKPLGQVTSRPGDKWVDKHNEFAKPHGLDGLDQLDTRMEKVRTHWVNSLPVADRAKSLALLVVTLAEKNGADLARSNIVWNIDQEINRVRMLKDICPCIVPGGLYLVSSTRKVMSGKDMAALQGVASVDLARHHMDNLGDNLIADLAGNAFSAPIVLVSLMGALASLSR